MNEKSVSASPLPSGRTETVYAGCKINLFLFITGRLPNGYHELRTLFVPASEPRDELTFSLAQRERGIRVTCDKEGIAPERNTLTRAYELYAEPRSLCLRRRFARWPPAWARTCRSFF